ncbi:hypothetical protein [Cellulosimicrobium sp. CUA-896]|uniref:hypothetical protein n=1 Tax=Cellulosimicrobium sp. CUA-896 TaxID=1517881 RepID=UPI00095E4223|nr:hypothetical protein [Cellulosimicrobium sp. CUA-896]OLT53493.1 hypothetical protein BJF88_11385 [Cellulosimicrobium sp. CUA-896]
MAETYAVQPDSPGAVRDVVRPALVWAEESFAAAAGGPARDDRVLALSSLALTREQAGELAEEIQELLRRWSDRWLSEARETPDADRHTYQLLAVLGPRAGDAPHGDAQDGDAQDGDAQDGDAEDEEEQGAEG